MQIFALWVNPHAWQMLALAGFVLGAMGAAPVSWQEGKATTWEVVAAMARRASWVTIAFVGGLMGIVTWWGHLHWSPGAASAWWWGMARSLGVAALCATVGGVLVRIAWFRYLAPVWSGWARARWIALAVDTKTDIRKEMARIKPREFDPNTLFIKDQLVLGQREDGSAYAVDWSAFRSTHVQIVGATGRGKGVVLQGIYTQAIRKGMGAWYFDPKGDAYIPVILAYEAAQAGRPLIILDLVERVGAYAPFAGGTVDERAERMVTAFQLERGGSESDYYKNSERLIVREAVKRVASADADLAALLDAVELEKERFHGKGSRAMESKMTAEALLAEWQSLPTIAGRPDRGLNVAQALRDNAVVYVRCGLRGLSADIASVLLIELMDELIRCPPADRGQHVVLGIDEAATLMSAQVVSGVTAVRSTGTTMILAYQALEQVRNMRDSRVDKEAAETTMNINCEFKMIYGTSMEKTAEQISTSAGRKRVQVPMSEGTDIGPFGGEQWSGKRAYRDDEDQLISTDTIKALPARVAVVLMPNRLAELVYTCWMPKAPRAAYDASVATWQAQVQAPPAPRPAKKISFGKGAAQHGAAPSGGSAKPVVPTTAAKPASKAPPASFD